MPLYAKIPKSKIKEEVRDLRKKVASTDEFSKRVDKIHEDLELLKYDFNKKYKSELDAHYEEDTFFLGDEINNALAKIYNVANELEKMNKEKTNAEK
jgi:hypothetical protein